MPRLPKGPHLKLRKQSGAKKVWYIHDGERRISTGCTEKERPKAQAALDAHIRAKYVHPPSPDYYVQQALDLYKRDVAARHVKPENTHNHLDRLQEFFRGHTCDGLTPALCIAYENWRCHTGKPTLSDPPRTRDKVKPGTVRRELATLQAALNHAWKSRKLKHQVPVTLPEQSPARERWLTPSEAARLLMGALGYILAPYSDIATRSERWAIWRREKAVVSRHLSRFILIGLRTGTRHDAILGLGWTPHADGGYFDLEHNLLFRAAHGARQTKKRKTPAPIPPKLLRHLPRWKRQSNSLFVINYNPPTADEEKQAAPTPPNQEREDAKLGRVTKAFNRAVVRAGLDRKVLPHTLRHTCVTWMVQRGVSIWEVAGFVGMSPQMVEEKYGHHAPEYLRNAANAA